MSADFTVSKNAPVSGDSAEISSKKLLSLAYNSRGQKIVAADRHYPTAATAAIVTYAAAGAGIKHVIRGIAYSYDATPTGGNLKVEDVSGTTIFSVDIASAEARIINFPVPIKSAAANTALIITLASGAGSVVGKVTVLGHSTEA